MEENTDVNFEEEATLVYTHMPIATSTYVEPNQTITQSNSEDLTTV